LDAQVAPHKMQPENATKNDRSLLQNIVSFIGLFCKRDLKIYNREKPILDAKVAPHKMQPENAIANLATPFLIAFSKNRSLLQ